MYHGILRIHIAPKLLLGVINVIVRERVYHVFCRVYIIALSAPTERLIICLYYRGTIASCNVPDTFYSYVDIFNVSQRCGVYVHLLTFDRSTNALHHPSPTHDPPRHMMSLPLQLRVHRFQILRGTSTFTKGRWKT